VDRDVVDVDAALGQQFLHVAGRTGRTADTTALLARSPPAGTGTLRTPSKQEPVGQSVESAACGRSLPKHHSSVNQQTQSLLGRKIAVGPSRVHPVLSESVSRAGISRIFR
jgi:hypothetical protein